jgi:hypothetical protein
MMVNVSQRTGFVMEEMTAMTDPMSQIAVIEMCNLNCGLCKVKDTN